MNKFIQKNSTLFIILVISFFSMTLHSQRYHKPIDRETNIDPYELDYDMLDQTLSEMSKREKAKHKYCVQLFGSQLSNYSYYNKPSKSGWYKAKFIGQDHCFSASINLLVDYGGNTGFRVFDYEGKRIQMKSRFDFDKSGMAFIEVTMPDHFSSDLPMIVYLTSHYSDTPPIRSQTNIKSSNTTQKPKPKPTIKTNTRPVVKPNALENEVILKSLTYSNNGKEPVTVTFNSTVQKLFKETGYYKITGDDKAIVLNSFKVIPIEKLTNARQGTYTKYEVVNPIIHRTNIGKEIKEYLYDIPKDRLIKIVGFVVGEGNKAKEIKHYVYRY